MFLKLLDMDLIELAGSKERLSDTFSFDDVLQELKRIPLKDVSSPFILQVLSKYKSDKDDWISYAFFSDTKYTRNLVETNAGKYNIILFCWKPGQGTLIHNHGGAKCFVKVLEGTLTEVRYSPPGRSGQPLTLVGEYSHERNDPFLLDDTNFLHQLKNNSDEPTVSLHVFLPDFQGPFNNVDGQTGETSVDTDHPYFSIRGTVSQKPGLDDIGNEKPT